MGLQWATTFLYTKMEIPGGELGILHASSPVDPSKKIEELFYEAERGLEMRLVPRALGHQQTNKLVHRLLSRPRQTATAPLPPPPFLTSRAPRPPPPMVIPLGPSPSSSPPSPSSSPPPAQLHNRRTLTLAPFSSSFRSNCENRAWLAANAASAHARYPRAK